MIGRTAEGCFCSSDTRHIRGSSAADWVVASLSDGQGEAEDTEYGVLTGVTTAKCYDHGSVLRAQTWARTQGEPGMTNIM